MSEEIKKQERKPRKVDIKISRTDHEKVQIYGSAVNLSESKVIDEIFKRFFDREDVKKVLEEDAELIRLERDLDKAERKVAELKAEIKTKKDSKK